MEGQSKSTLLIVDDDHESINVLTRTFKNTYTIQTASGGLEALAKASSPTTPDLILLDVLMPDMDGYQTITRLKNDPLTKNIPVIFISALNESEDETRGLDLGAVDYITKPFSLPVVIARVKTQMELKSLRDSLVDVAEERSMELDLTLNQLKKAYMELNSIHNQMRDSWKETIFRLTLAAEYKDEETKDHIKRVGRYTKVLAQAMGMDKQFCETIYYSAPIHDIGKVGIPDDILLKPGRLSPEEEKIMRSHTTIGAKILEGSTSNFLTMAREIALSHHERWNGSGYPHGLSGEEIPLPCRIMNIVDQYDALRSRRPFKSSFSHQKTFEIITQGDGRTNPDDFDPAVMAGFIESASLFNDIYHTFAD